ncbi:MAG: cobalamin B12-binding domain-containing protein [Deltaproteobacteria bacterium]|nr:cobalamin B12-binding domain-containing protein [Deltaproteobacteria bacterium]
MRVLLVQAPSVEGPSSEIVAPLGLGAVAAAARRAGHEVHLLDLNTVATPFPSLAAALARLDPEVVGVGLRNIDPLANRRHSYLPPFAALLATVRRALPHASLVVGGAGFSMFAAELMGRYPDLDAGIVLEGEETFPSLLARLEAGEGFSEVAGHPGTIVRPRRRETGLVAGPERARLSPAALSAPRDWLPAFVDPYRGKTSYAPAVGVETKRGCPLGCSYCVYPALQGRRLRFRTPEAIVDEVELLHREAGVEWVHFTDPVLNLPPEHFREVCRRLLDRKLPVRWTGFFREDALTREDAELAVSAGCAAFQFSGDGTCDRTLARLRKGFTRDDLLRVARSVAATDALAVYHFMVNVPGTDDAVARDAAELVDRLHDLHEPRMNLGAIVLNNLRVYPGTPLAEELTAAGRLAPGQSLLFPTYHDPEPFRGLRYELEQHHQVRACRWTPDCAVDEELP